MVAITLSRRILAACAALFAVAASPAFANASAASADITAPVRDAKASSVSGGDEQFKQLFSSWQALDQTGPTVTPVAVPTMGVSIPSRAPLAASTTTSSYGMREHPVLGGMRQHKGIDLAAPVGTPVYATADGTVERADLFSSYGLYVAIDHGANLETRYAHMSRLAVAAGEHVRKGDVIGYVGTTGRSTGPHLHYEVRVNGEAVNPIPYMAETPATHAVLAAK